MRRTQRRELNGCCTTINILPEMLLLYFLSRTDVERVTEVLMYIQGLPRVFREIYYSRVHSHSSVFSSVFSARPHQERLLCSLIKFSSR